jgi:hypothetical protein
MPVRAVTEAAMVASDGFVNVESMQGCAEAGLEVA